MHYSTLVTSLAVALAPLGVSAWAQDPETGIWRANNKVYDTVGGFPNVHEACTIMNSDTALWDKQLCDYWSDGNGGIEGGRKNPFPMCFLIQIDTTSLTCFRLHIHWSGSYLQRRLP